MELLVRTWVGHKPLNYKDPDTGKRRICKKGDEVKISAETARAFKEFLVDAGVARAKAAAEEAEKAAEKQVKASTKASKGAGAAGAGGGGGTAGQG